MAGRVLSKKNEAKIRAIAEEAAALLALLDGDDESDSDDAKESRRKLNEAANLGNWLESRIHLSFTEIADMLFGEGRLNREERIALSSAIGEALTSFNTAIAANMPGLYEREPWRDAPSPAAISEAAIEAEFVPLIEAVVRRDGTIPIKIIEPGWGSSGYYPAEVLERDGPKVFTKGLKGFWNHQTATEEAQRPEGDLNALAMELISDARYLANGPKGAGLYADAKVFKPYQEAVNELAPHIGVSIRASGRATQGQAEGRKGPIVQALTAAKTVDFVTEPGAGGAIIQMFEAARPQQLPVHKEGEVDATQFQEAIAKVEGENARLREALILRDAKDFVRQQVASANVSDVTKVRLVESLSANPPVKDGLLDTESFAARISETVKAEVEYLTKAAGYGSGRIEGMGGGQSLPAEYKSEEISTRMIEAFKRMGMSEADAKLAAAGRGR